MKMNRKILALATGTLLVAGGLSAAAFAGPGHGGGHFGRGGGGGMFGMRLLHLAERLNLTEEQELSAIRMRRSIREEAKGTRQEMQAAFADVLVELEKGEPNAARLHQLVEEASARMTKVAHSSVDQYLKFHSTLTPEQRKTMVTEAKQMKERRQEFRRERKQK